MKSWTDTLAWAVVVLAALAVPGCGETKCTMDTECPLPQICAQGQCTDRTDGFTDASPDSPPDGTDTPTDDGDGADVETDEIGPCTMTFIEHARNILGGLSVNTGVEGDPDFVDLVTLDNDQIWLISRIVDSPGATDTPKLTVVMVNPTTANPNSSYFSPRGSITLGSLHPITQSFDPEDAELSIATVFPDLSGVSSYQMMYLPLQMPPSTGTLSGFTGTDMYATEPAAASSDTAIFALWRQGQDPVIDDNSRIDFGIVDTTGAETATGTITGDMTQDLGQPVIVHNGTGYGLAWFVHTGASADTVQFKEIDAAGIEVPGSSQTIVLLEEDTVLVGRPALEWSGSGYALAWEESEGATAHVHFTTIEAGGASSTDILLDSELETTVGAITEGQAGMIDMVWTGERYGLVWVHENPSTGTHVWFFELDPTGSLALEPQLLNPEATQSHNPVITWLETTAMRYYVFAWNEFTSTYGWHVLYTYSYGCSF